MMKFGSPMDANGKYKYVGLPLQPTIFAEILLQRFDGKQFKREQAIADVAQFHRQHGGITDDSKGPSIFKKAASYLKDYGLVNINYGYWKLANQKSLDEIEIMASPNPSDSSSASEERIESYADTIVGKGAATIYVYYFSAYKKLASFQNEDTWPCKIGRTDKDPLTRILSQSQTCCSEVPHIALIIHCEDSAVLESTIHGVLKLRKQWIQDAPGTEWFNTNPTEVEQIYSTLVQS